MFCLFLEKYAWAILSDHYLWVTKFMTPIMEEMLVTDSFIFTYNCKYEYVRVKTKILLLLQFHPKPCGSPVTVCSLGEKRFRLFDISLNTYIHSLYCFNLLILNIWFCNSINLFKQNTWCIMHFKFQVFSFYLFFNVKKIYIKIWKKGTGSEICSNFVQVFVCEIERER